VRAIIIIHSYLSNGKMLFTLYRVIHQVYILILVCVLVIGKFINSHIWNLLVYNTVKCLYFCKPLKSVICDAIISNVFKFWLERLMELWMYFTIICVLFSVSFVAFWEGKMFLSGRKVSQFGTLGCQKYKKILSRFQNEWKIKKKKVRKNWLCFFSVVQNWITVDN